MTIGEARAAAADYVRRQAATVPGFAGAYISGSTVGQPDAAPLSPYSDVDVCIVVAGEETPAKLGKFVYQGAMLEVTYLTWTQLGDAEALLGSARLGSSFRVDTVLADPSGALRALQARVARDFAKPEWVLRRCEHIRDEIAAALGGLDTAQPYHDLVTAWLFPTGITTHLLLAAGLRNPTVRLRYLAARELLREARLLDHYEPLLAWLGCAQATPEQVRRHMRALARAFDAAAAAARTPFFFSADITRAARPIAIDAGEALIRQGDHREAVFWLVATMARCHKLLAADAPKTQRALQPEFEETLGWLGLEARPAFAARARTVVTALPDVWLLAQQIMAKTR